MSEPLPMAGAVAGSNAGATPVPPAMPLGLRINNPGNVRASGAIWKGMAPDQSSGHGFVVFTEARWGLRAMAKVLLNYQRYDRCATPRAIVTRFAPPGDHNDTEGYLAFMCDAERHPGALGLDPEAPITLEAPGVMAKWVSRQILREQGQQPYTSAEISAAIAEALAS